MRSPRQFRRVNPPIRKSRFLRGSETASIELGRPDPGFGDRVPWRGNAGGSASATFNVLSLRLACSTRMRRICVKAIHMARIGGEDGCTGTVCKSIQLSDLRMETTICEYSARALLPSVVPQLPRGKEAAIGVMIPLPVLRPDGVGGLLDDGFLPAENLLGER